MASQSDDAEPGGWLVPVLALVVLVTVMVAFYRAALEAPSGEGVPGPAEWARYELAHPDDEEWK